jgi:hypothetical protein
MIIVRILGGLGNQLFQYAAARSLAEQHNTIVKLDITGFKDYQLRNFDLRALGLPFEFATNDEIVKWKAKNSFQRIQSYLTPYGWRRFYKQPYFHYDTRFNKLGDNVYLQGFFQSEQYFLPIKSIVRKEYSIAEPLIQKVKALGTELKEQPSVALHIRRGDYKNEETLRYHGIVPTTYYQQAVQLVQSRIKNPQFYIFSDDAQWVKDNLKLEQATIVSGALSQTHFEDLYLMSQCRHNIIANSSFSWWGAWLNDHPEKIVIAPQKWFNEGPKDIQDLHPDGWIKL